MKKVILMLALMFSVSAVFVSCKDNEKEKTHNEHAADKADLALNEKYQCPMDCEKGKTYDEEGSCPECKMDLKKVEKKETHTHANGETHESHDNDKKKKTGHEGHNHD